MRRMTQHLLAPLTVALLTAVTFGNCTFSPSSGKGTGGNPGLGGHGGGGTSGGTGGTPPAMPCSGLSCFQSTCTKGNCMVPACAGGAHTTLSGTIKDPAGKNPLYNINVYVPAGPLKDITDGPSCHPCDLATGTSLAASDVLVVTTTDTAGHFSLGMGGGADVPATSNVPLVIQAGKWRRTIMLDSVTACQDTQLTDENLMRLPRDQTEGHIPKIALTTGNADALECLIRKIGVADSELTPETGTGRVNYYAGGGGSAAYAPTLNGGAAFTGAQAFWDSHDSLFKYDIVLLSCEGTDGSFNDPNGQPMYTKSAMALQNMQDFADAGGRVFASHWHVYWFERGPAAFKSIATFVHGPGLPTMTNDTIDQGFPTGAALAQWMVNVGGSTTLGTVPLNQNANMTTVQAATGGNTSQRWLYNGTGRNSTVQYMSATTPIPGGSCGRVVMSDLHVSAGTGMTTDQPNMPFPTGCMTTDLTPQEKVLEFMLFDIGSCVVPVVQ